MPASRVEYLLNRYIDKSHTHDEYEELMQLIEGARYDEAIKKQMDVVWAELQVDRRLAAEKMEFIFASILREGAEKSYETLAEESSGAGGKGTPSKMPAAPVRKVYGMVAAAVVAGLIAGGIYLFFKPAATLKSVTGVSASGISRNDVAPGGNRAVLTLADGRQIVLDSASGALPVQGNTTIIKLDEGVLAYNRKPQVSNPVFLEYNIISTPRGGQYQVILPDGTTVWLNSMSSLKFPVDFPDHLREAELTGEAYFQVETDKKRPFRVKIGGARIEVLGTGFNVMAYSDEEEIRTTLVNGAVKVINGNGETLLKPGEQARWGENPLGIQVSENVNMAEVLAWKNGVFQFNNATIQSIMRQAARWYDIEVEYKGTTTELFNGSLPRSVSAATLFRVFETTGLIKFDIHGKKVTVNL